MDLDGTLSEADAEYVKFIKANPTNTDLFYKDIGSNMVVEPVAKLMRMLKDNPKNQIIIVTGRPSQFKEETINWLNKHNLRYDDYYCRNEGDTRPDYEVKEEILQQIRLKYGQPYMVFEDRKSVIDMWIRNGIFVFDVAQGQGDF